jgi:hypothetical protein
MHPSRTISDFSSSHDSQDKVATKAKHCQCLQQHSSEASKQNPPNLKRRNLLQEDATYTYSNIISCHKKNRETNKQQKKEMVLALHKKTNVSPLEIGRSPAGTLCNTSNSMAHLQVHSLPCQPHDRLMHKTLNPVPESHGPAWGS